MIEAEIKIKIASTEEIREKLISSGFTFKDCVFEKDTYLDNADSDIRSNDTALRVRSIRSYDEDETHFYMTYKGIRTDDESMTRPEFETGVESAETALGIFEALGYLPVHPCVNKKRDIYTRDDITACLDEVEDLGSFLELEILTDHSKKEAALERLWALLSDLGLQRSETTTISYLTMLQKLQK